MTEREITSWQKAARPAYVRLIFQTRSLMSSQSDDDNDDLPSRLSPRMLAHVLARKERDSQQLNQLLKLTLAKLDEQSRRATDAERRATESLVRARAAIDARAQSDADATAARTELALYKMQLEQAQREINRAQEYLDGLEARRHDAEQDAARARSVARKLQEERAVEAALEQGKQQGFNEGLRQGILLGRREVESIQPRSRRRQEEHNRRPSSRPRRPTDVHFARVIPESPQQSPSERSSPDQRRVQPGYVPSLLHLHLLTPLFASVSVQISHAIAHQANGRMTPHHLPFHPHHPNVHDHDPSHAPVWRRPLHPSRHVPAHTHLTTIQRLPSSSPSPSPPPLHPWGR